MSVNSKNFMVEGLMVYFAHQLWVSRNFTSHCSQKLGKKELPISLFYHIFIKSKYFLLQKSNFKAETQTGREKT